MPFTTAVPQSLAWIAVSTSGLILIGGLLYLVVSCGTQRRQVGQQLETAERELQERSLALAKAEAEVERLKRIPKAELLPMLKLAHEQRSPLAAIQNALDMLLQGYAANDPELLDEMLELARERAATMLERVNDFLRLGSVRHAEIERKVQPVQLLEVLQKLAPEKRIRARWKAVDFETGVPDTLPVVMASPQDIEHLLSNLINNAIKYTDSGGKVVVSLEERDDSVVGIVQDTGVGIAPQDLPKIFDEFYRADGVKDMAQGSGLGLAIAKRVVDLYGGHIDVESEPGKGSKFRFHLPKGELVAEEENTKTFRDLQAQVICKGICGKCSTCTAFCSAAKLRALTVDEGGLPIYADEDKCLACGICYLICPLTSDLDAEVRRRHEWRLPIGAYRTVTSARATGKAVREAGIDGGVATALLLYLLENYLVQGVVVPARTGTVRREHVIATTRDEIIAAASSQLALHGSQSLMDERTTYSSASPALKELERLQLNCVAMLGTPCQIRTIRKMQCLGVSPSQTVGYTLGRFCMEHLTLDRTGLAELEAQVGMNWADIRGLSVNGELSVLLYDGSIRRLPLDEVAEMARPTCLACTEFASDYADISIGGQGSPDGLSTVLIRTEKGNRLFAGALGQGYVEETALAGPTELRSAKTRMLASVVAHARRKRERGEARLKELGFEVA
jgi:coenzyme F420 hydrogenase subunit beta